MTRSNIIAVISVLLGCVVLIVGISFWLGPDNNTSQKTLSSSDADTLKELPGPLTAEELDAYNVTMTNQNNPIAKVTTNKGVFDLELFEDTMPITAGNFIKLANEGFYDGVKFHRVIEGFMIQGGDPITKTDEVMRYGTGGPGYSIPDEHISGEYLTNIRGTISMANSGPNSGGSQFFINVADNTNLDFDKQPLASKHPVFGHVIKGMDVVDQISVVETGPADKPVEPVVIEKVEITNN